MNVQTPLIRLVDLCKAFGRNVVLDGLSLDIREHESIVILGPSGTGKSVLLKHIVGILRPDAGKVLYRDKRIDNLSERNLEPIRKHFGFLFQGAALFDSMNVLENIAFPLREHTDHNDKQIREIVAQKLAMVGLSGTESKMPADLSGGMKKRVALARAIALDPEVVLYDEPTTGLDPIRADVINELILKLNAELHVTSIIVTHDMTSAFKVADRMVMLSRGKVIAEGSPDAIRTNPNEEVQNFVLGKASPEDLEALHRKPI
ncbi:MAG: ABC transporter ATP-binding protein [Phycisphaerales bacterium]|nr:ABC transporter ATP-binding protein [Phycisphaerales bacterium]